MIDGFLDGVHDEEDEAGKAMENVVKRMNPGSLDFNANATVGGRGITGNGTTSTATISQGGFETGNIESLLNQLIQAVHTNKDVFIDGQKVTGAVNNENAIDDRTRYF
ncbi:hypothetical protein [Virgibacillus sp. CBA3643]|uniref:hypothetical protein n=1 Tax=Virgibacillus sp. CBA3643 TaxID=2942278 RepID=UPI0035A29267